MSASTTLSPAYRDAARRESGLFARMIRSWLEHHRRMLEMGIEPL